VDGGAEKVRPPREPELNPPPTRASAEVTAITAGSANAITTATAFTSPCIRCEKVMLVPQNPRQGEAPLRWAELLKCEALIGRGGCGSPSREHAIMSDSEA